MRNLSDFNILITGASSGIGRQLAIKCATLKARTLILVARRLEKLKEIEKQFPENKIICIKADLSTVEGMNQFLKEIRLYSNEITHVFNNAGFGWYGFFKDMSEEKIQEMINVNILALTNITKYFLNLHKNNENNSFLHIFNIGSIAGIFPIQGIAVYSATKSYVESFTKSLQSEYAKDRSVYFTLVLPGAIKTEFFDIAQNDKGAKKIKINMFELSVDKAVNYLIGSIFKKKKIIYIPPFMKLIPLIDLFFGKIFRSLGPILLEK